MCANVWATLLLCEKEYSDVTLRGNEYAVKLMPNVGVIVNLEYITQSKICSGIIRGFYTRLCPVFLLVALDIRLDMPPKLIVNKFKGVVWYFFFECFYTFSDT